MAFGNSGLSQKLLIHQVIKRGFKFLLVKNTDDHYCPKGDFTTKWSGKIIAISLGSLMPPTLRERRRTRNWLILFQKDRKS